MQSMLSKNKAVVKEKTLFDQANHSGQTMCAQEERALELHKTLSTEKDPSVQESLKKEIFEIEKYCQTVNMLLCGGV